MEELIDEYIESRNIVKEHLKELIKGQTVAHRLLKEKLWKSYRSWPKWLQAELKDYLGEKINSKKIGSFYLPELWYHLSNYLHDAPDSGRSDPLYEMYAEIKQVVEYDRKVEYEKTLLIGMRNELSQTIVEIDAHVSLMAKIDQDEAHDIWSNVRSIETKHSHRTQSYEARWDIGDQGFEEELVNRLSGKDHEEEDSENKLVEKGIDIDRFSERQKEVIDLCYGQMQSLSEAAATLGITKNSVATHVKDVKSKGLSMFRETKIKKYLAETSDRTSDEINTVGKRLTFIREYRCIGIHEAAHELDVPLKTLRDYEGDKRVPELIVILGMADLYKVSMDWLLFRTNEFPSEEERQLAITV